MINQFSGEYAFLSNFYPSPIAYDNSKIVYPTVEHYFQAMKTFQSDEHEAIRIATTPGEAKRLGRRCTLREDWENIKDEVMHRALKMKFKDPELRAKLLATGDEFLVEGNTWGDRYWGVCEGRGLNKLGQLLMIVREECRRDDN